MAEQPSPIQIARLANGVTVLTESIPDVESVALGVWADAGSADEPSDALGVAHYLEHMLFKGTQQRTAYDLAVEIEDIGGHVDAYTERELTHVGARILAEHLPVAINLIADMVCHSTFDAQEMERERQVIIEEIRKYQGVPEERIHDLLMEGLWYEGGLGHAILGTEESIAGLTRDLLAACWARHFSADRVVIAAAGKLEHDRFVAQVSDAFADLPAAGIPMTVAPTGMPVPLLFFEEDSEQVNFSWGIRAMPSSDPQIFPLALADIVLGSSTTSRLFQEIREKRGLAYDIGSYLMGFRTTGLLCINGAASPETFPAVMALIHDVVAELRNQGITPAEWARAKTQMKAGMALGLEGTSDRMRRLAQHYLTWQQVYPLGYLMDRIDAVTLEDVHAVLTQLLDLTQWSFTAIGPVSESELRAYLGMDA